MVKLDWASADRRFDFGVDRGVLYFPREEDPLTFDVVPWNGLLSVDEKDTGSLGTDVYFDGRRLQITQDVGNFEASVSAITYPPQFDKFYGGMHQRRKRFHFSYRTQTESGYQLHVVLNAIAKPSSRSSKSLTESIGIEPFDWDISAADSRALSGKPAAHLMVDTGDLPYPEPLVELENALYGTDETEPHMPSLDEILTIFEAYSTLLVRKNLDGTWTAIGSDDVIQVNPDGTFVITAPTAQYIGDDTYQISSF